MSKKRSRSPSNNMATPPPSSISVFGLSLDHSPPPNYRRPSSPSCRPSRLILTLWKQTYSEETYSLKYDIPPSENRCQRVTTIFCNPARVRSLLFHSPEIHLALQ